MNSYPISLRGERLRALPSGALWWPAQRLLAVGDLHLGRAERVARLGGALLPPYETTDTLERLEATLADMRPRTVVLLGDSFDDMRASAEMDGVITDRLVRIAAGRQLVWISGNHDPGPGALPGTYRAALQVQHLVFRHIATSASGEISAHYHPKMRLCLRGQRIARPCFLADADRIILPAFGTYTGGLDITSQVFDRVIACDAVAILTGRRIAALPRQSLFRTQSA